MSSCSITIKIKDYFPKIESIPYQNFICLFTNGESEGQIPLISKDNETYKHQIKNVLSDIKYKIHVLDYNDMSLIGMCEMVISYAIINQITPPNGFIQEQQKKLLMDTNTKRKLFGTVLNMGDIYLNIYSEIYLCENKSSNINTRKKNKIGGLENGAKKKLDGSPRTVHKKQLMMQINSDRRALININKKGNINSEKIPLYKNISASSKNDKNMTYINSATNNSNFNNIIIANSSFNYKDVIQPPKENINNNTKNNNNVYKKISNNIKNKNSLKYKPKKNIVKNNLIEKDNFLSNNTDKDKNKENNLINNNIFSKYKTESNKNNVNTNTNSTRKKLEKIDKKPKNKVNKNSLVNNISPKLSNENFIVKEEIPFNNNNTGNKITTIESLENIDFSGRKYITTTNPKKNNSKNNINVYNNNTFFSTTSTEQEFSDMDKIILEKGTEIRNDFNIQLKNSKKISLNNNINNTNINSNNNTNSSSNNNNSEIINDNIIKTQTELKNNFLKLIGFYSLLSQKLLKINDKNYVLFQKNVINKEKLFNELKKNNALTQKQTVSEVENFMNINNHGSLNEKFLRPMIKMKKLEFKIFQNIFNLFYYEYDILKFKEYENNKKLDENVKIELLIMVFKNLVKNYGNISQIYLNNNIKKNLLKNCFGKYGIKEKENGDWSMVANSAEKKNMEKNKEKKENKNDLDKFKVIKEVDEEKEEEFDDEDKLNSVNSDKKSYNQISISNSNIKENNIYTNEKLQSDNKSGKNISEQKKLFEIDENYYNEEKNNKLNEVKYNLSEKIIENEDDINKRNDIKESKNSIKEESEKKLEYNDNEQVEQNNQNEENIKELIDDKDENNPNKLDNDINNNEPNIEINPQLKDNSEDILLQNKKKENLDENKAIINNDTKEKEEKQKAPTKREIYTRKNRQKYLHKEPEQEENKDNNIINNDKVLYKKNKIKKEIYDEEDLMMQKILIEDFPKKCKEENRFIRISKYEYSFGEEKIKVIYKDGIVILKLDEGDYKLQEFIDILNEGKNEEDNYINENNNKIEEKIEEVNDKEEVNENKLDEINNNEINQNIEDEEICNNDKKDNINNNNDEKSNNILSDSEKKNKKRRKKRVSEDLSFEKENSEKEQNLEENKNSEKEKNLEENKNSEKKEIIIEKEIVNNFNNEVNDINKVNNTEGNESDISSENKTRKYVIKRRRDYKKLK